MLTSRWVGGRAGGGGRHRRRGVQSGSRTGRHGGQVKRSGGQHPGPFGIRVFRIRQTLDRPYGPSPSRPGAGRFAATSVTWVSPEEAFVLGTAPCAHAPCTAVIRTLNRGVSWTGLPAPAEAIGPPPGGNTPVLWGIRFATREHGFAFGGGGCGRPPTADSGGSATSCPPASSCLWSSRVGRCSRSTRCARRMAAVSRARCCAGAERRRMDRSRAGHGPQPARPR
jgi:hypothetical protein